MAKTKTGISLRAYGIDEITNCIRNGVRKVQVKGTALKLKHYGFPTESYFGPVPAGSPPEIMPVPTDGSTGLAAGIQPTVCTGQHWCIEVNETDPIVTNIDLTLTPPKFTVSLVLWNYYENMHDTHILVEQLEFREEYVPNPAACGTCSCP
jgi:hypothetical protein